ncbi:MAG: type 1 glutamine amidotransferase [Pseudomonadota bacterium]
MARVLVVEGNTPEVVAATMAAGCSPAAEQYAAVLEALAAERGVALETMIARPSFPDADIERLALEGFDGVALTGSGVSWSADDARAGPHRRLLERVFAAGIPAVGSCWGLQVGAVVLGGAVGQGTRGLEIGVARHVCLTAAGQAHALHAGRDASFDVPCIHRDEVTRLPQGAVLTASNDHSEVQAMVYEEGGVRFWGLQYHPEGGVEDMLAYLLRRDEFALAELALFRDRADLEAMVADMRAMAADPAANRAMAWRYGIRPEVLDPARRRVELANWLAAIGITAVRPFEETVLRQPRRAV